MSVEESIAGLKTDFAAWLHRLQHGKDYQSQDPVFDGMVRDFLNYDATLHAVEKGVDRYMEGVEALAAGMSQLSEACVLGLTKRSDAYICRDACRYREAVHRICRTDAPNAALAKLRRDLQFNVADPLRKHREHNRKLKHEFQVRRRRLAELVIAKRALETAQAASGMDNSRQAINDRLSGAAQTVQKKPHQEGVDLEEKECDSFTEEGGEDAEERGLLGSSSDPQHSALSLHSKSRSAGSGKPAMEAEVAFEEARQNFKRVDDVLFEWLQMLELYRCDIFDSLLQSLKYVQYEFFATSAHAVAHVLPKRMEFRPMVEMTPQHLQAQIEIELAQRAKDHPPVVDPAAFSFGSGLGLSATERLVEKWERDAAFCSSAPPSSPANAAALSRQPDGEDKQSLKKNVADDDASVDILSLAVLTAQGFSEAVAKAALVRFENDTQGALDFLLSGGEEELRAEVEAAAALERPAPESGGSASASSSQKTASLQAAELAASAALDDVRLPTTLKWVQRLREIRRQERLSWQRRRAERDAQTERGKATAPPSGSFKSSENSRKETEVTGESASMHAPSAAQSKTESSLERRRQCLSQPTDGSAIDKGSSSEEVPHAASRREAAEKTDTRNALAPDSDGSDERNRTSATTRLCFEPGQDAASNTPLEKASTSVEETGQGRRLPSDDLLQMSEDAPSGQDDRRTTHVSGNIESDSKTSPDLLLSLDEETVATDDCTVWPVVPLPELLGAFKASNCAWSNAREVERKAKEETEMLKRKIASESHDRPSAGGQGAGVGFENKPGNVERQSGSQMGDSDGALETRQPPVEDLLS